MSSAVSSDKKISRGLWVLAEILLICPPLVLLHPKFGTGFQYRFFGLAGDGLADNAWWIGLLIGTMGAPALGTGARGVAWFGYCAILGAAVTEASVCAHPDLLRTGLLSSYAAIQLLALGWMALVLVIARFQDSVLASCRVLVAVYAAVNMAAALVQLLVLKSLGTEFLMGSSLLPRALFVREGDTVHTEALRLVGLFQNPNTLGACLVLTWPALAALSEGPSRARWMETQAVAFLAGLLVICTYSRAAYLGLALQVALLFWSAGASRRALRSGAFVAALFCILGALAGLLQPRAAERAASIAGSDDASITNRLTVYGDALRILAERPLHGLGVNGFHDIYNRYWKPPHLSYHYADVHSSLLHGLMETGLLGAMLFGIAVLGGSWRGLLAREERRSCPLWVVIGLGGCLIPLAFDNFGVLPGVLVPLLAMLAVLAGNGGAGGRPDGIGSAPNPPAGIRRSWDAMLIPAALAGLCFVLAWFQPVDVPAELRAALDRAARAGGTRASWYVRDEIRGVSVGSGEDRQIPEGGFRAAKVALAVRKAVQQGKLSFGDGLPSEDVATGSPSAEGMTIGDAVAKMLKQVDASCMTRLERLVTSESVDRHYEEFARRHGVSGEPGTITPRAALLLLEELARTDLHGNRTLWTQALSGEKPLPQANDLPRTPRTEFLLLSHDDDKGVFGVVMVADEFHRWGASIFLEPAPVDSAGEGAGSGHDVHPIDRFLIRCQRALYISPDVNTIRTKL